MEFLILLLALMIRALFMTPSQGNVFKDQIIPFVNNRMARQNSTVGVLISVLLLSSLGLLVAWQLGHPVLALMEGLLFIYLYTSMNNDNSLRCLSIQSAPHYREGLIRTLAELEETNIEDVGQPDAVLETRIRALYLYKCFVTTFVLSFCYLALGWLGLVVFAVLYNIDSLQSPQWLENVKKALEWPAGILAALAFGVAGRLDTVLNEVLNWSKSSRFEGAQIYALAIVSAIDSVEELDQTFAEKMQALKALQIRGIYVWVFVWALIVLL